MTRGQKVIIGFMAIFVVISAISSMIAVKAAWKNEQMRRGIVESRTRMPTPAPSPTATPVEAPITSLTPTPSPEPTATPAATPQVAPPTPVPVPSPEETNPPQQEVRKSLTITDEKGQPWASISRDDNGDVRKGLPIEATVVYTGETEPVVRHDSDGWVVQFVAKPSPTPRQRPKAKR